MDSKPLDDFAVYMSEHQYLPRSPNGVCTIVLADASPLKKYIDKLESKIEEMERDGFLPED